MIAITIQCHFCREFSPSIQSVSEALSTTTFRALVDRAHLRYNIAAQSMMESHAVESLKKASH